MTHPTSTIRTLPMLSDTPPQNIRLHVITASARHGSFANLPRILNTTGDATAGEIKRLVLGPEGRTKLNNSPDRDFYSLPRFVKHVDENFIGALTELYRDRIRPESEVLDLMSSWVSHLPDEVKYKRVVGHGMNAQELARNQRLDYFFVKDLNKFERLEIESNSFDVVLCTVSLQYLQQPEKVFAEVFRVLRPGGTFIVSFSNRLFYEKAISAWRDSTAYSRTQLVVQYFQCIQGFTEPEIIRRIPAARTDKSPFDAFLRLVGLLGGSDPLYAVIAHKNFKQVYELMENEDRSRKAICLHHNSGGGLILIDYDKCIIYYSA